MQPDCDPGRLDFFLASNRRCVNVKQVSPMPGPHLRNAKAVFPDIAELIRAIAIPLG
jgi:hypothetical protein